MKNVLVLMASIIFLTGCGSKIVLPQYSISADNVVNLRKFEGTKIAVDNFTFLPRYDGNDNSIICGSLFIPNYIATPDGKPFATYIQKAFEEELKMAGVYDPLSHVKISGSLEEITPISNQGLNWNVRMKISSNNGKSFITSTSMNYGDSILFWKVCDGMLSTFVPLIQNVVNDIIANGAFSALITEEN
jgi:hypothetical protein